MLLIGTTSAVTLEAADERWYVIILTSVLAIMLLVVGYFLAQFISSVNKSKAEHEEKIGANALNIAVHKTTVENLANQVSRDIKEMNGKLNSNRELKNQILTQLQRIEAKQG